MTRTLRDIFLRIRRTYRQTALSTSKSGQPDHKKTARCFFQMLLLGALTASATGFAAEQLYQVELYIFEQPQGNSTELWPNYRITDFSADATLPFIRIQPSGEASIKPFEQLPPVLVRSKDVAKTLSQSRYYRLLYQGAWQQEIQEKANASPIYISAGKQTADQPELEGVVRFYKGRYLHIDAHVVLGQYTLTETPTPMNALSAPIANTPLNSEASANVKAIEVYELKQSRRMRSGELHYLDHPKVGVLVQVHRVGA